jgi:glycosyltransferase involved in cell wall biosynthesis
MNKISIITVVRNGVLFIKDSINSFLLQKYPNKELIIILGKSDDGTSDYIKRNFGNYKEIKIFEEKNNIKNKFGALNQGLKLCSGEIIGILHSDDIYYSENVLHEVSKVFLNSKVNFLYSDIIISSRGDLSKILRVWKDPSIDLKKDIQKGWMPPHTSVFIKKEIFKKIMFYEDLYNISGDYAWMIKLINHEKTNAFYINKPTVIMRSGGDSNMLIFRKFIEDLKIIKTYKFAYIVIFFKYLKKVKQFFLKKNIIIKTTYIKKILYNKLFYVYNYKILFKKNSFILSGLNLASFTYLSKTINKNNFYYWPDGLFSKFIFNKIKKIIPGRILFKDLYKFLEKNKIFSITAGTLTKKADKYLEDYKYSSFLDIRSLDFNGIILKLKKNINKKHKVLILVLPTPLQENVSLEITNYKKNLKVICLGGSFRMLSGEEKIVPSFIEKIYLSSFWRLHTSSIRRIIRLVISLKEFIYFNKKIYYLKNIKVKKLSA